MTLNVEVSEQLITVNKLFAILSCLKYLWLRHAIGGEFVKAISFIF